MSNEKGYTVTFDTKNSIIIGDYLDVLLNGEKEKDNLESCRCTERTYKVKDRLLLQTDDKEGIKPSRLKCFEHIMYCESILSTPGTVTRNSEDKNQYNTFTGGILLPNKEHYGSGNIVISGAPGVGKTTLAFQIAAACASTLNKGIAIYYSLDMDSNQLIDSMVGGDENNRKTKVTFPKVRKTNKYQNDLKYILADKEGKIKPQILMPQLTPRGISSVGADDIVFQKRFEQLELMVNNARRYNDEIDKIYANENKDENIDNSTKIIMAADTPKVKLMVIDSMNTFGEKKITHEQIHRIFELFRKNRIIGIFTLGMFENSYTGDDTIDTSAALFLSDVVINLYRRDHDDYSFTFFEITKSRHIKNVLGKHLYKIVNVPPSAASACDTKCSNKCSDIKSVDGKPMMLEELFKRCNYPFHDLGLKKKVQVWPSLHNYIYSTEGSNRLTSLTKNDKVDDELKNGNRKLNLLGIAAFRDILPEHFAWNDDKSRIVALIGGSGLYKSDIAIGSLIAGIIGEKEKKDNGKTFSCSGGNGLIIRMADKDDLQTRGVRLSADLLYQCSKNGIAKLKANNRPKEKGEEILTLNFTRHTTRDTSRVHKYTLNGWCLTMDYKDNKPVYTNEPKLFEVIFKSGALCPEEFIYQLCGIIQTYEITRLAIMDLKLLDVSYPFLINSPTSGKMFLSTLVHIIRNYDLDAVFSASNTSVQGKDISSEIAKLSDATIEFIKGEETSEVYVNGEGLITKSNINKMYVRTLDYKQLTNTDKDKGNDSIVKEITDQYKNIYGEPVEEKGETLLEKHQIKLHNTPGTDDCLENIKTYMVINKKVEEKM